ncbi:bifunctional 2-polyprenyl-6-hydroxyphenol methylase/3-demethylubiquinol 3-O-methyltransferase UbiG [Enterovirga aerilata]|uniref:Ubiquinone biosynthesis O-methyltransferase n=1 Tax=Enterovirga aerilata TaxID=2730920 RepID=A0A849I130_9HYPH|nr:bifunctional 2-polyprenyl-6-hydroxyphenol methylase/3-demethylubiquinol 3-O-methyltransferase UbiG [Enterovirga sp. DB1703]NNM71091.1 bifunctional 2-polyprenyl-6-hydroxyphenol methylase/3-demethylubiquinol 3-O-methyltransferase UbiG [Enterovirga sp. DB1703]
MSTQRAFAGAGTVDRREVDRFDRLARDWWDPKGPMRALHRINPLRMSFIRDEACRHFRREPKAPFPLAGLSVLDVGCGAGLLSEPVARLGGAVTGLDPSARNIEAARRHAAEGGLAIEYRTETVEEIAARGGRFDLVIAMEVVEHVPEVESFVRACGAAVAPGGLLLLATINRTMRSFALAILGAEYLLKWLPKGTHDWEKFVTPDELREAVEAAGLTGFRTRGMVFNPVERDWSLSRDTAVNYLAAAEKPAGP